MFKANCLNKERELIKMIALSSNLRMRKSFLRCRVLDVIYFLYSAMGCIALFGFYKREFAIYEKLTSTFNERYTIISKGLKMR